MRRHPDETLRAPRYVVVTGGGGRGTGCPTAAAAAVATSSADYAATATAATIKRERVIALAVAVDGAFVRRQGCRRLTLALFHRRRRRRRLPVPGGAAVALATTPSRDDLATILSHRLHSSQVRALSVDGQYTPAVADTPVHPQLANPADSLTTASFLLHLSVIVKPEYRNYSERAFDRCKDSDNAMWK